MNERIKELVKQAGGEFWQRLENDVVKENAYITFDPPESLEKFAELIVRECIKVMEEPDYGSEHDFVIVDTGERIKKHFSIRIQDLFGVEE